MEVELIELKKSLHELEETENQENIGDLKKWESNFWKYIEVYKSKYNWCKKEFDDVYSLKGDKGFWADDKEMIPPKNSARGYIDSYKKLLSKIEDFNSLK